MAHEPHAPAPEIQPGFQPESTPDALSKKVFFLTVLGAAAFIGVVLIFVV